MNQLLTQDLEEVLGHRASVDQITAMRVVGVLGLDDITAFRELVADEYGLDAAVRVHVGSFSARFTRP